MGLNPVLLRQEANRRLDALEHKTLRQEARHSPDDEAADVAKMKLCVKMDWKPVRAT
jgi:hypothetical protein